MAAVLAHKGHTVVGVDVDAACIAAIQDGRAPVNETGLAETIRANRARLSATLDCEEAVLGSDLTSIMVPTPSDPDGRFSMRHVLTAAAKIGTALRKKTGWHLVALGSTVMPGSTGGPLLAALEAYSGKKCGRDFGLCYNPEFVALGSVIHDLLNPDMVLIGESDERSGKFLESLYRGVCESAPSIRRMNFVNAELTKLTVNTFVTTKISYANMLAEVCETLPGADVDVVTAAIGCDSRIGNKYLRGALGYGGPCFPRDNLAFSALARAHGAPALLAEATGQVNQRQIPRLAKLVFSRLPEGGTAAVLGLAYKPGTDVIDESQGVALAKELLSRGVRVTVYDPRAMENARAALQGDVTFAGSAAECVREADVLVVATPWEEFRGIRAGGLKPPPARPVLVDCWRMLDKAAIGDGADYVAFGIGAAEPAACATPGVNCFRPLG